MVKLSYSIHSSQAWLMASSKAHVFHYYKNDFARHCPTASVSVYRLMKDVILFTETKNDSIAKSGYGVGCFFTEVVRKYPLPKTQKFA